MLHTSESCSLASCQVETFLAGDGCCFSRCMAKGAAILQVVE
jgi:hypothetical protein